MNRSFTDADRSELIWLRPEAVSVVWKMSDRSARVLVGGVVIELVETAAEVIDWIRSNS